MCPSRVDPSSQQASMRTPNPSDHPAPRGHSHDEGVVPTRISETVEPTNEPAVLPFDLVVRVDDQREEALLLVLPQVDGAQIQPVGGIIGVGMVEEVRGRWRTRPKQERTQEDHPPSTMRNPTLRFWESHGANQVLAVGSPQPDPFHRLAPYDGISETIRERAMLVEAPALGAVLVVTQRQADLASQKVGSGPIPWPETSLQEFKRRGHF